MRTRLYLNRWLTFVASCLLQASAGLSYSFSIFAPALKELWGYRETQIAAVGSCFNIGGYLAIPSGALYDRLEKHKRFGPRFVALIGVVLLSAGYLGLYAAATGLVAPSFGFVCLCAVLGGNSSTWFDTASIVTNVRNFPHERGTVVGILKAFVGLSASIYSSIYAATFAPSPGPIAFLRFIGSGPPLFVIACIAIINLVPEAYHEPEPQPKPTSPSAPKATVTVVEEDIETSPSCRGEQHQLGHQHQRQRQHQQRPGQPSAPSGGGGGGGGSATPTLTPTPTPSVSRFSPRARFTLAFSLVGLLASYQAAAAVWAGAVHPGPTGRRVLLGGLLGLLSVMVVVPVGSGDWVHRKPRPEAVERVRRSLLARLAAAAGGAGTALAAAATPRRWHGGGGGLGSGVGTAKGAARRVLGRRADGGGSDLLEPLLHTPTADAEGERTGSQTLPPPPPAPPVRPPSVRVASATPPSTTTAVGATVAVENGSDNRGKEKKSKEEVEVEVEEGEVLDLEAPIAPPGTPSREAAGTAAGGSSEGEGGGCVAVPLPAQHVIGERELEAQLEALEEVPALVDLALGEAARTPMFWLLLFQFSVGLGTGLSFLNNLGSITVALGGQPGGQVVFVSLFSVANATGRLLGGVLSEHFLRAHGIPRTTILLAASCLTLLGVGGAAASELSDLYVTALVSGLAFGAHWGLIPAITSDLFGLTHFGSNYTGLQLGPAAGGYLLATVLTGKLYDKAARRHGDPRFCNGADCYFETWCVLGVLNLISLIGTRELCRLSARRYKQIVRGGGV